MASLNKLMKQAMRAQQQAEQVQAEMAERTVEATSGGGAVKVVARCDGSVQSIKVDPEALSPDDAEMLEDMLLSAVNSAISQGQEIQKNEMAKITSGMGLPGMGM
ncbi:MAG: YbaB/EbfC family nucleoid-associated protein [Verrucomicrobiota bacterium]|nr:YbaB/EbfC family nucleoid-associated protein [Verrucomicrobiota bacterium]